MDTKCENFWTAEAIAEKFTDVEEKVRSTACRALGSLHYEVAAHHVSASTLKLLGDRLRDKKVRSTHLMRDRMHCNVADLNHKLSLE